MLPISANAPPKLLNTREVAALCGVHRASIDRAVAAGTFPRPLMMGPKSPRWSETAVGDFFAAKSGS